VNLCYIFRNSNLPLPRRLRYSRFPWERPMCGISATAKSRLTSMKASAGWMSCRAIDLHPGKHEPDGIAHHDGRPEEASANAELQRYSYLRIRRQDRKVSPALDHRQISATLITSRGADRVLTMTWHAGQIQGFFNIRGSPFWRSDPAGAHPGSESDGMVIVSPDAGGGGASAAFGKRFESRSGDHRQTAEGPTWPSL